MTTDASSGAPRESSALAPGRVGTEISVSCTRWTAEIRAALAGFIGLTPTLQSAVQHVIEAAELAVYQGRWQLRGTDPTGRQVVMGGNSVDVLRRQPIGRWLIALDNPWGAQLLDAV